MHRPAVALISALFTSLLAPACSEPARAPAATATATATAAVAASCAPQQFSKAVDSCCGLEQWFWDGAACVDATGLRGKCGCTCTGPDCGKLFSTRVECETAHAACAKR